jgi:CheY-like chemotaxis protein
MVKSELDPALPAHTILVVEDDVLVRALVCDALRDGGLQVVEAASADEALRYLETDSSIQLVFSDVKMPGSMDGMDLAKRLKLDFPHLTTVLTSGHLLPGDVDKGTLLIMKPYPIDEIAGRIMAILDDRERAE